VIAGQVLVGINVSRDVVRRGSCLLVGSRLVIDVSDLVRSPLWYRLSARKNGDNTVNGNNTNVSQQGAGCTGAVGSLGEQ
jgi:hypothetical protein